MGLCINHEGVDAVVKNFREIGCAWRRFSFHIERAGIVNCVMNVHFDNNRQHPYNVCIIKVSQKTVEKLGKFVILQKFHIQHKFYFQISKKI